MSDTGAEVVVARSQCRITVASGIEGGKEVKEVGREEWVAVLAVREEEYRVLILSLICSLCKSQQSQEMPGPSLQLIAIAITKEGFL